MAGRMNSEVGILWMSRVPVPAIEVVGIAPVVAAVAATIAGKRRIAECTP